MSRKPKQYISVFHMAFHFHSDPHPSRSTMAALTLHSLRRDSDPALSFIWDRHLRMNKTGANHDVERALVDAMDVPTLERLSRVDAMAHMLILQNDSLEDETEELCRYIFSKLALPFALPRFTLKMHALRLQTDLEENLVTMPDLFSERNVDTVRLYLSEMLENLETSGILADDTLKADEVGAVVDSVFENGDYTLRVAPMVGTLFCERTFTPMISPSIDWVRTIGAFGTPARPTPPPPRSPPPRKRARLDVETYSP